MRRQLNNFAKMWDAYPYPNGEADQVKQAIGGQVEANWITNTCVIRVSRSFNYAGHPIPDDHHGLNTITGADGLRYAFRVQEFYRYLLNAYGQPMLSHTYVELGGQAPPEFIGRKGIICFIVKGWTDATGHMDLWDGRACIHQAYFDKASKVHLWEVPDQSTGKQVPPESPRRLIGSVGLGGQNRPEDVQVVQALLKASGLDPGSIDGLCGPATIAALRQFQGRFLQAPDGRVDPNGRTWHELNGRG